MSADAWTTAIAVVRSTSVVVILSTGFKIVFHFVRWAVNG